MQPTRKAPAIDELIKASFGIDRRASIQANQCVWCKQEVGGFRDALSEKEFTISGMCQSCQDEIWASGANEENPELWDEPEIL